MIPDPDEIREWFKVTEDDLNSAQILLDHDPQLSILLVFIVNKLLKKH